MQSRGFASVNTLSDPEPQQRTPDVRVTQDGTSSVTFNLTLLLACFGLDRVVSGAGVALCKDELSCDGTSKVGSSVFTFFYLHFGLLSMSIFQNVSLSPYPSLCLSFHFFLLPLPPYETLAAVVPWERVYCAPMQRFSLFKGQVSLRKPLFSLPER